MRANIVRRSAVAPFRRGFRPGGDPVHLTSMREDSECVPSFSLSRHVSSRRFRPPQKVSDGSSERRRTNSDLSLYGGGARPTPSFPTRALVSSGSPTAFCIFVGRRESKDGGGDGWTSGTSPTGLPRGACFIHHVDEADDAYRACSRRRRDLSRVIGGPSLAIAGGTVKRKQGVN